VTRQGVPVTNINELEYIDGSVWANVWFSDEILQIDPSNGNVTDAINFAAIYPKRLRDKELNSLGMQTLQHYTYMCIHICMHISTCIV
jgi:glutamine cyclotransferase